MSLWFELAQVFRTPVRILRKTLTMREFWQWAVYRRINGPLLSWQRSDWQAASICQAMVGGKLSDHRLQFSKRDQTEEEMLDVVRSLGGSCGGVAPTMSWRVDPDGNVVENL